MQLADTDAQAEFRAEARTWLRANVPAEPLATLDLGPGFAEHVAWEQTLHAAGWSVVHWPEEFGGRGVGLETWLIFEEEYWLAGAPARANQNGIYLLAPTIMEYGTPEQQARFLPPMAASTETWAQGWSEPDAGSDLAAIRTTARRDGDEWVLNGQKTWASRAVFADWIFVLARTEPGSERHRGLSMILMPLDTPGVEVRPIVQLDGTTGFAEVFFDDARAPVANTLGPEGRGWHVAMSTAGFERGVSLRPPGRFLQSAKRLIELWERQGSPDGAIKDDVVQSWMDARAYDLFTKWTVGKFLESGQIGPEASVNKIFWSEADVRRFDTAMTLSNDAAQLMPGAAESIDDAWFTERWLFSLAGPIYAGTNEIQRNIIAERVLGLPRS